MDTSKTTHGGAAPELPPGPSLAQLARRLLQTGGHSTLATLSKKHPGFPFASLMPYSADDLGRPHMLISAMAMHTKNLLGDPRCTLLIVQAAEGGTALGAGRLSVMGRAERLADDEEASALENYLSRHPEAEQWSGYGDFRLFRLEPIDVYFVGGFGLMGWISAAEFAAARIVDG